jgi:Tol biopolymer transport system component
MRKVLAHVPSIFLLIAVFALALTFANCGSDHHAAPAPAISQNFAYIQALPPTLPAAQRHQQVERQGSIHASRHFGLGMRLHQWNSPAISGSDSIVMMKNDGTGDVLIADQQGTFGSVQLSYDGNSGVGTFLDDNEYDQIFYADLSNLNNVVVTQLTTDAEDHYLPQLSWDGSKIVFLKYDPNAGMDQIAVMNASGGAETLVATPFNVNFPSFTPDGKIVFEQEDDDTINIINADGTGNQALTNPDHAYFDEYPSVSPDGTTITFARYPADESTGEDIWTVKIDGTNPTQLTTDGMSYDPMFVNDRIVFVSYRDTESNDQIYSMLPNGSSPIRLTTDTYYNYFIY